MRHRTGYIIQHTEARLLYRFGCEMISNTKCLLFDKLFDNFLHARLLALGM